MPAVAILLLLLLGFWAFIVWDRRRMRNVDPLSREIMAKGFAPASLAKWKVWAGLSAVAFTLGISQLLEPMKPPFTGRWSWLESLLYFNFGPLGMGTFALLVGFAMLVASLLARRGGAR